MSATPEPARVEHLESRRLLSVALTNGVLTVIGSDRSDFVRVSERDGQIVVRDSTSGRFSFDDDEVDQVLIRLGAGNDRARLTGVEVPSRVEGDGGADFLTGGNEDDTLLGGDGPDRLVGNDGDDDLRGEDGNDRLEGGDGDDRFSGGDGFDRAAGGPGLDAADQTTEAAFLIDAADAPLTVQPGFWRAGRMILTGDATVFPREHPGIFNQFLNSGQTATSGFPVFSAQLPGFQPLPQAVTFPGFLPFPQNAQPFGIDVSGLDPATAVIPIDPRLGTQDTPSTLDDTFHTGSFVGSFIFSSDGSTFFVNTGTSDVAGQVLVGLEDIPTGVPNGANGPDLGAPGLFNGAVQIRDGQGTTIQVG